MTYETLFRHTKPFFRLYNIIVSYCSHYKNNTYILYIIILYQYYYTKYLLFIRIRGSVDIHRYSPSLK